MVPSVRMQTLFGPLVWLSTAALCLALDPDLRVSQYQKHQWQVEDGLPHNYVFTVLPGPAGYLLIGTDEGLARFDGVRFTAYDLDSSLRLSNRWVLSMFASRDGSIWTGTFDGGLYEWGNGKVLTRWDGSASVFSILVDSSGRVWASTREGVMRRDSHSHMFERLPGLRRPPDTAWNVLSEDATGSVWLVTADGLYRERSGVFECVVAAHSQFGDVLSVNADPSGVIEMGTSTGLFQASISAARLSFTRVSGVQGPVVGALRDRDGNLWAATWGAGACRVSTGGNVQCWSSRDGLADDFVRTLYEDGEGNLWMGLRGGGLARWKNPALVPVGIPEGLRGEFASVAATDRTGVLWLGTWRGGLYQVRNGNLIQLPTPLPALFFTVRTLAFDLQNRAWIGNWEGLYRFDGHSYKHFADAQSPFRHVSSVLASRDGSLWVGTSDNGVFCFSRSEPDASPALHVLGGREVTSLIEDRNGTIWIGTPAGIARISRKHATPIVLPEIANQPVTSLSEDCAHRIWACSLNGALWLIGEAGAKVIDTRQGLPGYPLYRAIDDGAGSLWVSSPRGILRFPLQSINDVLTGRSAKVSFTLFDREDGMRTIELHRLSQPAGARDRQGYVWFPTSKGFVRITPHSVEHPRTPPPVLLESIALDGKPVETNGKLRIPRGPHALEIRFTALHFASASKIRFRYRMRGLDGDWSYSTGLRMTRYSQIPPGDYRFEAAAAMPGGIWGAPAGLDIQQAPRFYQTRWFAALLAVCVACAAYLFLRWQMFLFKQRYLAVEAERSRIAREWHDTLLAGFSAISLQLEAALVQLGKTPEAAVDVLNVARKMVQHYRAEARRVIWDLRDSRPHAENLHDEISRTLAQVGQGRNVKSTLTVTGEARMLPKDLEHNALRICQEAVSNALRHGQAKSIHVQIRYLSSELQLKIEDDGIGFSPADWSGIETGHFGLSMMSERAQRFGGTLSVVSQPGQGTVVEAGLPMRAK